MPKVENKKLEIPVPIEHDFINDEYDEEDNDELVRTTQITLLPECYLCPICKSVHYDNNLRFRASISGNRYGVCAIRNGYLDTDIEEDDINSEDEEYFCEEDDENVTRPIQNTMRIQDQIQRLISSTQSDTAIASNMQRVALERGVSKPIEFHPITRDNSLLAYVVRSQDNTFCYRFVVYNPDVINLIKNNNSLLEQIPVDFESEFYKIMINNFYFLANVPIKSDLITATKRIEIEPDPLNSRIIYKSHHKRFQDVGFENVSSCEHCNYAFETDSNIESFICPRCNKQTNTTKNENRNNFEF